MVFLSQDDTKAQLAQDAVTAKLIEQGLQIAGWREVPVEPEAACGQEALRLLPKIGRAHV